MSLESLLNEGTSGFQGSLVASHVLSTHQGSPKDQNFTVATQRVSLIYEEVSFLISHRIPCSLNFLKQVCVCTRARGGGGGMCVVWHMCGGQRTT